MTSLDTDSDRCPVRCHSTSTLPCGRTPIDETTPCITPGEASRVTILLDLNVLACDFDESDAMRYDGFGERNTRIITLEKPPQSATQRQRRSVVNSAKGCMLMYEREQEKRTNGAWSSLILIKGAASKVFAYRVDVSRKVDTYSDDL